MKSLCWEQIKVRICHKELEIKSYMYIQLCQSPVFMAALVFDLFQVVSCLFVTMTAGPCCLMQSVSIPLGGDETGFPGGRLCLLCHHTIQPICQLCRCPALTSHLPTTQSGLVGFGTVSPSRSPNVTSQASILQKTA